MKPILRIIRVLLVTVTLAHSQEEASAVSRESAMALVTPTTAHVLGDLADGTPPAPEPPKPKFIISSKDILETKIHQQGGRQITIQKITPIALPQPFAAALPDVNQPAIQERVAAVQAKYPDQELLFVGASVFRAKDMTVRSLVCLSPQGNGESVTFWTSADFALLSGFTSYVGSDGETHSLIMSWGVEQIDDMPGFITERGREYGISKAPELPTGKATFAIISDRPSDDTLASIQSLHDLYNNEHERLKTAYEGRERARLQQEAELKAHPPKPKDIVLNYWRTEKPVAVKGGAN